MKTLRDFSKIIGLGSLLTLGLSVSLAHAAPSPRPERNSTTATMSDDNRSSQAEAMACPTCRTGDIRQFRPGGAGGKVPASYDLVGKKHTCAHCGMGSITIVNGVKTDSMTRGCAMCGKDVALCLEGVPPPPAKT